MPSLHQMFPSKYLQPEDLERGKTTIVTISKVWLAGARVPKPGADPEPEYMIEFAEFRKPAKLKAVFARTVADVLGSDRTEDWIGHRIGIFPIAIVAYGKTMQVIQCDLVRPPAVAAALPGTTAVVVSRKVLPRAAVDRFVGALAEKGAAWSDFLAWLKKFDRPAHDLVAGCDLDQITEPLVPRMKAYRDAILGGATPTQMLAGGPSNTDEIVDTTTGEVTPAPAPAQVDEEDIPF